MAFIAEVKARLGMDTTPFQRALTATVAQTGKAANDIGRKMQRAFGAGDAFRGILQGIGIGSVQQISDLITRPFSIAADRAKEMESYTGSLADIATKEIAALNGRRAEIRMTELGISAINTELGIQQKLIDDLKANPLTYINDASMQMLLEAERKLNAMRVDQAKMLSDLKVSSELRKREAYDINDASAAASEIAKIERKNGSEREKELVRLKKINDDIRKAYTRGLPVNVVAGLWQQHSASIDRLRGLDADARKQIAQMLVGSGESVAGRGSNMRRGRTESERIADRGAMFKRLAEDAVLRGNRQDAARYAMAAQKDFRAVGLKTEYGSGLIPKGTASVMRSEILSAAESLRAVAAELEPKNIK